MTVQCRMVNVVLWRRENGVMWSGECGLMNVHSARWVTEDDVGPDAAPEIDYSVSPPDAKCDRCGEPVPWGRTEPCYCDDDVCPGFTSALSRFGGIERMWDTPSGRLEPGCMFWVEHTGRRCFNWDNCDGRHLHVVLPNNLPWDIDSRANNCTLPEDRHHRCWVRTGEPPRVSAGKAGYTCAAGAGSILSGGYHGFLTDGVLT